MDIHQTMQGAVAVIRPIGPLSGTDAAEFKKATLDAATRNLGRVVMDASEVPFIDSLGIEALLDATEELSEGGRALKLCGAAATIRTALDLTGVSDDFEFFEDVNAAVRSFL